MADSHNHVFADSAKASDRKDFMLPRVSWPIASASTRRQQTAAG